MNIMRKFEDVIELDGWEIETDTGWHPVSSIMKTVPYAEWYLELEDDYTLNAADTHVVFNEDYKEVFMKDLSPGDMVMTKEGPKKVLQCYATGVIENMFDITVESEDHRYYANDILNHNTTCSAAYLLWRAMFVPNSTILLAANKLSAAQEIMSRIRYAYESLSDVNWLRAGIREYNKQSLTFDNNSRIVARATTPDAGRGLSISCVTLDTNITVSNGKTETTDSIKNITGLNKYMLFDWCKDNTTVTLANENLTVLTEQGFKSFSGYTISKKKTYLVQLESSSITATGDHRFFDISKNDWVQLSDLNPGDRIKTKAGSEEIKTVTEDREDIVVDLTNVADTSSYYTNDILSHNCLYLDEFAFVKPSMAEEFWSAIQPTLSTGGDCIITSTPNNDEDKFAQIWKGAITDTDEHGHQLPGGVGINNFYPINVTWDKHPDRDDAWALAQRREIGESKFRREFNCLSGSNRLSVLDTDNNETVLSVTDLANLLQ